MQMRRDDRAGRCPNELLAPTQVKLRAVLDPCEQTHHPRLSEDSSSTEHEDVRAKEHCPSLPGSSSRQAHVWKHGVRGPSGSCV